MLDSDGTIFGLIDREMRVLKKTDSDLAVEFVVFDEENTRAVNGREINFGRGGLGFVRRAVNVSDGLDN
jgi:hypothetical protein